MDLRFRTHIYAFTADISSMYKHSEAPEVVTSPETSFETPPLQENIRCSSFQLVSSPETLPLLARFSISAPIHLKLTFKDLFWLPMLNSHKNLFDLYHSSTFSKILYFSHKSIPMLDSESRRSWRRRHRTKCGPNAMSSSPRSSRPKNDLKMHFPRFTSIFLCMMSESSRPK